MTHSRKTILSLILLTAVLALAFTVIRTVHIKNYYDVTEGHFRRGSDAVTVATAMTYITAGILLVMGAIPKAAKKPSGETSHVTVFSGALCGFMFISSLFIQIFYFAKEGLTEGSFPIRLVFCLSMLLTIPSAMYYFKSASTMKLQRVNAQLLSFCPVLWCITYTIYTYFSTSLTMNSPMRLSYQATLIAAMLAMVLEARSHIGIPKQRLHIGVSLAASFIILVLSIPEFLLSAFWLMPFGIQTVYSATLTAYAVYTMARLTAYAPAE